MSTEVISATPEDVQIPRRGRPVGWRMPTLAELDELTLEDFSFVRGVVSGMEPRKAFLQFYANRHFDAQGNPIIPHGVEINHLAARLEKRMLSAALASDQKELASAARALEALLPEDTVSEKVKVETHMGFASWAESLPEDMYGESELPERYRDYLEEQGITDTSGEKQVLSRALTLGAKVKAINYLQTQLASLPQPTAPISHWLARPLLKAFISLNVTTMAEVVAHISETGRHWHRSIKGLGPGRALRVEGWLDTHAKTLGAIDRQGPQWESTLPLLTAITPLQRAPDLVTLVYESGSTVATPLHGQLERRFGIAPLELLLVPSHLDGRNGMFRTQAPNHLGVNNDCDAVLRWLGTYHSAGKHRTLEAYRREVERFFMWSLLDAQCALSSVSLSQAQSYQAFLKNIPERYISTARVSRDDERWRPWRGQLSPQSQNYAIGVIYQLYNALLKNGYVTGNPFESIKPNAAGVSHRIMDTTRSLHAEDLAKVRKALADLPGLRSSSPREAALARRTRLILHLALTTGLRLAEISGTDLKTLRHPIVDGQVADDWLINVVGKGSKTREVPISEQLLAYIREHHADWEVLMPKAAERLKAFQNAPPLVAALEAPVRSAERDITDETVLAHDNAALSRGGIYRTLKTFFRNLAKGGKDEMEKKRIRQFSTHWLRHTFAHEVLRANEGDEGLKLAQQLLGHKSINTTAEYVKQDQSAKVKAARKVNPLG
jgi:site-specific recombinase XerD